DEDKIVVVRRDFLAAVGYSLILVLGIAAWRLRNERPRKRYVLLVLWILAAAMGVLWLPLELSEPMWWLLVGGLIVAASWYLRSVLGTTSSRRNRAPVTISALVAGLFLIQAWPGVANESSSSTVLLLPGPANEPGQQTVLVSPELLERLKVLAAGQTRQ